MKTLFMIICFFLIVSFNSRQVLRNSMVKLIDTAVLNNISLTFGNFYLSYNSNGYIGSIKFKIYTKNKKKKYILKREWLKNGKKCGIEGEVFTFKLKQ